MLFRLSFPTYSWKKCLLVIFSRIMFRMNRDRNVSSRKYIPAVAVACRDVAALQQEEEEVVVVAAATEQPAADLHCEIIL